jgi:hypothetical protein
LIVWPRFDEALPSLLRSFEEMEDFLDLTCLGLGYYASDLLENDLFSRIVLIDWWSGQTSSIFVLVFSG